MGKKKINVAVIGTIGVGKTTFIQHLKSELNRRKKSVYFAGEPSVEMVDVNNVLKRLYTRKMEDWVYPLQSLIASAQESMFQDALDSEYDVAIFDMPYSSYIYDRIHLKHGRISEEEVKRIDSIYRIGNIKFDHLIVLRANYATTLSHVRNRNKNVAGNDGGDLPIEDFSYLKEHISDFKEIIEEWKRNCFPESNVITIDVPDERSQEYNDYIHSIADEVSK